MNSPTSEIWKKITNYPHYQVSSMGRVRRVASITRSLAAPKIILGGADVKGYRRVKLTSPCGQKRTIKVHRLVAEAFLPNTGGKPIVAHKNGDPEDNRLSNLRWATQQENLSDRIHHGTEMRGRKNGRAKLTRTQVEALRAEYRSSPKKYGFVAEAARRHSMAHSSMYAAIHGRNW